MQTPVEQIKERLSIVDVVGEYVKLERAGKTLRARCPFHAEKTASFYVSPERGSYHCFGCHRGGDIFSFLQEIEGYDFRSALSALAERAGVTLSSVNKEERSVKHEILKLLEEATLFYQRALLTTAEPKEYLKNRSVTEESVRRFRIGYAPREWHNLYDYLKGKGFPPSRIEESGLIIRRNESAVSLGAGYYDRFRGRVMFPIMNTEGSVIGFSGRILPGENVDAEKEARLDQSGQAKYINTPQTMLYDKSKALFGYSQAKDSIRHENVAILVEGQMDVVLSHQAGIRNTVAVSGTALTGGHLSILGRLTDKIIMAFDADSAGIAAAERSIYAALESGFDVSVAVLPEGKDPADLVRELPSHWHTALQGALHVIDFYLTVLSRTVPDVRERGKAVHRQVIPLLARLGSEIDRAHFIGKIAESLSISEEPLWRELSQVGPLTGNNGKADTLIPEQPIKTAYTTALDRLRGILFWQEGKGSPLTTDTFTKELLASLKDTPSEERKQELVFEAEQMYGHIENLESEVETLTYSLREYALKEAFAEIMDKLKRAESEGNEGAVHEALKECQRITQQLNDLHKTHHG